MTEKHKNIFKTLKNALSKKFLWEEFDKINATGVDTFGGPDP